MDFSGIIEANIVKPPVEVDFYPFKAITEGESAHEDDLYAEVWEGREGICFGYSTQ